MNATSIETGATVFHFHDKHASVEGKSCRLHQCFSPDGELLLTAHAFRSFRPTAVFLGGAKNGSPDLLLKMRKSFPLTGRIDLLEAASGDRRGVVTRGRKFFDSSERLVGRFVDPTTWKQHLGESLIDAAGQLLVGGGDAADTTNGSDRFVLTFEGGGEAGSLVRQRLPFFPEPPRPVPHGLPFRVLRRLLPGKWSDALFRREPPMGWKLEVREHSSVFDITLLLCAALMTIEIRRW